MTIRQILVPVDFSSEARRALDQAIQIAQGVGAEIHIIHTIETLTYRGIQYAEILSPESGAEKRALAKTDLGEWCDIALESGIKAESHVVEGDVRHAIKKAAEDIGADLIVIGARGHSRFEQLLGSTADFIARTADCSVLIARATPS